MGNRRSRELTRPKERGAPCTCDVFDLSVVCENDTLVVSLLTDLPVNTRVTLDVRRLFLEKTTGQHWEWTCFEDSMPVMPQPDSLNGFVLRLSNEELDTKGLHMYQHLKRVMGLAIADLPSTNLAVSVSAPSTQHRFGSCNRRLTGKAVIILPHGHFLERSANIGLPLFTAVTKKLDL